MLPNCAYCTAAALDDGGGKSSLGRLKGLQRRRASALSPEKSAKRSRDEIGALMSKRGTGTWYNGLGHNGKWYNRIRYNRGK